MRFRFLLPLLAFTVATQAQDNCNVTLTGTSMTCPNDNNATLTVVAGTPGQYTYAWSQDQTLQSPTATGLAAGPYSVTVTDTSGCISFLDTVVVLPDVPPLGTMVTTDISCAGANDGSVTFTMNTGPYTWQWLDQPAGAGNPLTNLGPGVYVALVSGGACPSYIFGDLGDPAVLISGPVVYCAADPPVLTADLQWGFHPDLYIWSTGDSTSSINVVIGTEGMVAVTAIDTSIGCVVQDSVMLTERPSPTVTFTAPDSLCILSEGSAHVILSNADSLVWRWGTDGFSNEPTPTITFHDPEWQPISLQGFDSLGCGNAPVLDSIYVRPIFPAVFTAEQVPCTPGIEVQFASDADSCAFFVGDRLVMGQCRGAYQVDLERYNEYDLTFYSTRPDHCDDTSKVHIDVRTVPTAFLPNSFSPNGDNINDRWPGLLDIPDLDYRVQIFDRWGELLWSTNNTEEKWDGGNLPVGVYVYVMHMRDPCQPTAEMTRNGTVTLLR